MPYPTAYRTGALNPSPQPRPWSPGRGPTPYTIPPRPANDPIGLPDPANDNTRTPRGPSTRWIKRIGWISLAYTVTEVAFHWKVEQPPTPDFPGYNLVRSCGGGGFYSYLEGHPSCNGEFIIDSALPFPPNFRPSVIYSWSIIKGAGDPYPESYVWAKPGSYWEDVAYFPPYPPLPKLIRNERTYEVTHNEPYDWWQPFHRPGFQPRPRPVPFPFIPGRPVPDLPETREVGPAPRPRTQPRTGEGPTWDFDPDRPAPPRPSPDRPSPPAPPPPRTRERKVHAYSRAGVALQLVNVTTETVDVIDAFYNGLPWSIRRYLPRNPTPQEQAYYVFRYFRHLDVAQVLMNLATNEVEDRLIGELARGNRHWSRRQIGRLVGFSFGPAI